MGIVWRLLVLLLAALSLARPAAAADKELSQDALWAALRAGGHVALMRHAMAPGVGDPEGFRLDDCATQRNLSEPGRRQARDTGELFRRQGVTRVDLYSSQWCRCLDTARLLGLGEVRAYPALNSFFDNLDNQRVSAEQTARVKSLIFGHAGDRTLLLVTHQVNMTALTGIYPQPGEILVLRPRSGKLELLGRLRAPGS
jgi:phosphohistidine phosphatase SixA